MTRRAAHTTTSITADWTRHAACRGQGLLMAPPRDLHTTDAEEHAIALCFRCPVLTHCRTTVLALPDDADPGGVCAAMTEPERTHYRTSGGAPLGSKRCNRCHTIRPLTAFWRDRRATDGHTTTCKPCRRPNPQDTP